MMILQVNTSIKNFKLLTINTCDYLSIATHNVVWMDGWVSVWDKWMHDR